MVCKEIKFCEMKKNVEKYSNLNFLYKHAKSDPALIIELINIYLAQTPGLVAAMKKGLAASNWKLVQAAAHKITPSFKVLGVKNEYEVKARKIEELAALNESNPLIEVLINELETTCNNIYTELQQELLLLTQK